MSEIPLQKGQFIQLKELLEERLKQGGYRKLLITSRIKVTPDLLDWETYCNFHDLSERPITLGTLNSYPYIAIGSVEYILVENTPSLKELPIKGGHLVLS
jgi:hypothetical protein